MTAAIAPSATRVEHASALPRVAGATLSAVGTLAAVVGIGLFVAQRDARALFPGLSAAQIDAALRELGWTPAAVITIAAVMQLAMVVVTAVSAAFILWSPRSSIFHAVLAATLVFFVGTATTAPAGWAAVVPAVEYAATGLTALACGAFLSLWAYFPTGTLEPRWAGAIPVGWTALIVFSLLVPWWEQGPAWVVVVLSALAVSLVVGGIVAQVQRFRRVSDRTARQQTKWVVLALVAYLVALLPVFFLPPGWLDSLAGGAGVGFQLVRMLAIGVLGALIPVAIAVAVVKYRLFDVDLVIRRTVVAVALVVLIALLYAAAVGGAALVWNGSGPVAAIVATVCAALVAHPLRVWLGRRATRWVYGRRSDPYEVVRGLGADLVTLRTSPAIAERIADVVVDDLRYSSAVVDVRDGPTITRGDPAARVVARVPLVHDDVELGTLTIGADAGDRLSAATERLVDAVAAQGSLALSVVRAAEAAQTSRERLLVAREEERQRLYRDLHDGLGPGLAGARQRIETAVHLGDAHPVESTRLLEEAADAIDSMLVDVRALVHGLRPPALDELGLADAVRHAVRPLAAGGGARIEVRDAPDAPAAVEVAAYRIAVEAVTNAVRHSGAARIEVTFEEAGAALVVEVSDDGRGVDGAPEGRGRRSMRERAEELGGSLAVRDAHPGTVVHARLPLRSGGGS